MSRLEEAQAIKKKIKVLVDDSALARQMLAGIFSSDSETATGDEGDRGKIKISAEVPRICG